MTPSANQIPSQPIDESKKISLPKLWPYRLIGNILILLIIGLGCIGIMMIKSSFVTRKLNSLSDYFFNATTYMGFTVDDILVFGRDKTSFDEVNNIVNARLGDNILLVDIHQLKNDLEQLAWVKQAIVSRSYFPNIIQINLTEKKVQAIWQINNNFYPIDSEGKVIQSNYIPPQPTLLIIGKGAPENINSLLDIIKEDKSLYSRVKVANYISERRWNIVLDDIENGITIKLPQENVKKMWKKLIKLDKTKGLLKRKLTIVDLRFEDKVLVRPRKLSKEEKLKLQKDFGNNNI